MTCLLLQEEAYLCISRLSLYREQGSHKSFRGVLHECLMFCYHKILVLVQEVLCPVCDSSSIVINGETSLIPLGLLEPCRLADVWRAIELVCKVLVCRL